MSAASDLTTYILTRLEQYAGPLITLAFLLMALAGWIYIRAVRAENKSLKSMLEQGKKMEERYTKHIAYLDSVNERLKKEREESQDKIKRLEKEAEEAEKRGDIATVRTISEEIGETKNKQKSNEALRAFLASIPYAGSSLE